MNIIVAKIEFNPLHLLNSIVSMALNGNSFLFSIQYLVNINSIGHHSDYKKGLGLFVL